MNEGLTLTEDLKWGKQIDTVVKKISKVVGILYSRGLQLHLARGQNNEK